MVSFIKATRSLLPTSNVKNRTNQLDNDCIEFFAIRSAQGSLYSHVTPT
jgi:hypothetical protein